MSHKCRVCGGGDGHPPPFQETPSVLTGVRADRPLPNHHEEEEVGTVLKRRLETTTRPVPAWLLTDPEYKAQCHYWQDKKRCPLILPDWLRERGLETEADVAQWAVDCPNRRLEPEGPVRYGPTPYKTSGVCSWVWDYFYPDVPVVTGPRWTDDIPYRGELELHPQTLFIDAVTELLFTVDPTKLVPEMSSE